MEVFIYNNEGQIVGHATTYEQTQYGVGFIWDETQGMIDLNDLIIQDGNTDLLYISGASDINDYGQIVVI